jgi:hypothetical protein
MPPDDLTVTVSIAATRADGKPFSRTTNVSYRLDRRKFQTLQRAVTELLLGFGDQAVAAHEAALAEAKDAR